MQQWTMGVDAGGTKILIGLVSKDGTIVEERRYESRRGTQEIAIAAVNEAVYAYWEDVVLSRKAPRPDAMGMGLVGQGGFRKGIWIHLMATPINDPYPICDIISKRLGIPVYADNDVHCATIAEMRFGMGLKTKDFVYLNIGTGVAAGLVSDGRLIRGSKNMAGEVGHMTVNMDMDIMCKCGRRGCMEEFSSGGGMLKYARSLFEEYPDSALVVLDREAKLFSSSIFDAARKGDLLAGHIKDLVVRTYVAVFQDLINLMDPAAIVVGGGVFQDELLLSEIKGLLRGWLPMGDQNIAEKIELSSLDPQKVGLLGASLTAWAE